MIFNDTPTTELFIPAVLKRTRCSIHGKEGAQPCWWVPSLTKGYLPAVCNPRAQNAGFVGQIDPRSLEVFKGGSRARS